MGSQGTFYLIHLQEKLGRTQHYAGWAKSLSQRIKAHRQSDGSAYLREANRRGIAWDVVYTQPATKQDERRLKRQKCFPRRCPVCRQAALARRRAYRSKVLTDLHQCATI